MVDAEFFDASFWNEVAGGDDNHRMPWRQRLYTLAEDVFDRAAEAAPRTEARRLRAQVRGRSFLDGQMRKWIKEAEYGE